MDQITEDTLKKLSSLHPKAAVSVTHQFLDGFNGKECGFVPKDWDGKTSVTLAGRWWKVGESKLITGMN